MILYDSITGKTWLVSEEEISELRKLVREITNDQNSSEISIKDIFKILLRKRYY